MRADDARRNARHVPVVKIPLQLYSDAFNAYNLGGSQYSVNGTYWGLACVRDEYSRRVNGTFMCSVAGPHTEWQREHAPLTMILAQLQQGGMARMFFSEIQAFQEVSSRTLRLRGGRVSGGGGGRGMKVCLPHDGFGTVLAVMLGCQCPTKQLIQRKSSPSPSILPTANSVLGVAMPFVCRPTCEGGNGPCGAHT